MGGPDVGRLVFYHWPSKFQMVPGQRELIGPHGDVFGVLALFENGQIVPSCNCPFQIDPSLMQDRAEGVRVLGRFARFFHD